VSGTFTGTVKLPSPSALAWPTGVLVRLSHRSVTGALAAALVPLTVTSLLAGPEAALRLIMENVVHAHATLATPNTAAAATNPITAPTRLLILSLRSVVCQDQLRQLLPFCP
jgi:hypothetical protein